MEERFAGLEKKINGIASDQNVCKIHMEKMCETLATLADVRSESVHIMKTQIQIAKEHDEIFSRLRTIETDRATCQALRRADVKNITDLQSNQRWGALAIVGAVLAAIFKMLFTGNPQ